MSRAAVTNPPGLPRRSRISFLRPAATSSADDLVELPRRRGPRSRTAGCSPTVPSARSLDSTSGWTITARTISTSTGLRRRGRSSARPAVSFGPRTLARACVEREAVDGASRRSSSITSPGRRPAFSAGESGDRRHDRPAGSPAPSVVHEATWPRCASTVPIVAPIPSNSPEMPCRLALNSSEVRYCEYGSSERADHPLDRALDERLAVHRRRRRSAR